MRNKFQDATPTPDPATLPTYTAAVVEFAAHVSDDEKEVAANVQRQVNIINSADVKEAQIVVFPDATLNSAAKPIIVPKVEEKIVPCGNEKFSETLRSISCAAKEAQKYVVVQVYMKRNCKDESLNDTRPCTKDDINIYNTAVAIDRNGQVVAV